MPCYAAAPRYSRAINFPPFPVSDLAPLFRLFDESAVSRPIRSFQPRFDVREEKNAFQLNGELPGVDQEDVQIEFVDENTLVIRGKTVRESSRGSKSESAEAAPAAAEKQVEGEKNDSATNDDAASETYHKASVEEEYVDVQSNSEAAATPATEVGKPAPEEQPSEKPQKPKAKYWVSERSVGEFKRSFTFPGHVNQDAVTASLKNGILSVVVPKALAKEPKRIVVE